MGWTSEGKQEQGAHSSEVAHAIYGEERYKFYEDGFEDITFGECTPRYPGQERWSDLLGNVAEVKSILDGPVLHGWPTKRMC